MAIDLPQTVPPQLVTIQEIHAQTGAAPYEGTVNGYKIIISGQHYLTNEEIDKVLAAAQTTSQAIIILNAQVALKGHYLVVMTYATDNNSVYVHAVQKQISKVEGDGVAEYFDNLVGGRDLTRREFIRDRVIANVKSKRTGVNYDSSFRLDTEGDGATLVFVPKPVENHDATDLKLTFGNQGSRYVGRYFGEAGLSHNFSNGARASIAYETAFVDLGESREGENYHGLQLGVDKPFSAGLYGVNASHIEYSQNIRTTNNNRIELETDINVIGVGGEQVLASDLNYRFNLFERLEYIDSQIKADGFDAFQEEKYGTLELGAKYFSAIALSNRKMFRWSAQLSVKGGVTEDSGTLGTYDLLASNNTGASSPAQVSPEARTSEFVQVKPNVSFKLPVTDSGTVNLNLLGQFSDEQVPQQQQWVLGGMSSISAYLPGILAGDSGYFIFASYEHKFQLAKVKLTSSVFTEYGAAWFENVNGMDGDERSIADAGLRLGANFGDGLTLDAVAARNIADSGFSDSDNIERLQADFYILLAKTF